MSSLAIRYHDPLRPPPAPGLGRGMLLALLAHALLVIALSAGVSWHSKTEPAFEAELWASVPVAAAPREEAPPPEPEQETVKPPPKPVEASPPDLQAQRDAEIAIAKEREKKKKLQEQEQQRLAEQEAQRRRDLAKKEQELKELKAKEKAREDKTREDKLKDDKAKQDKLKQEAGKKAEAALEKQRQDNLRRIQGMAGATGAPNATGTALQSAAPSASYGGRIKARIRPNIIYSDPGNGNPIAEVEVRAAPDGAIIGRKLVKPSGNAEWDQAVLRAIDKTEALPRDVDGRVPSLLVISFQPRE